MSLGFSDEENIPGIDILVADEVSCSKNTSINADMIVKDVSGLACNHNHTHSDQFVYFDGSSSNFTHISKFYAPTVNYSVSNDETITHLELDIDGFVDQVKVQKAIDFLHGKCEFDNEPECKESLESFGIFWTVSENGLNCYTGKAKIGDIAIILGETEDHIYYGNKKVFYFDGKDWVKFKFERPDYSYIEECEHYEHENCLIVDKYLTHITYLEELLDAHDIEF